MSSASSAGGSCGACRLGCGRPVAPGLTRSGKQFDTCCRPCAKGQGHDAACDFRVNVKGDWEIKLAGEWKLVGIAERSFMEGLERRGESSGTVQLRGQDYEFDLATMSQKNVSTGKRRPLRRVFKPTVECDESVKRADESFLSNSPPEPLEVTMNVYDVSTDFKVQTVNGILCMLGSGAYHVAIEVFGLEWSFGYCEEGTGVFRSAPRACQAHHYRSSQVLGAVQKTRHDVEELLRVMSAEWRGNDYDLLRRNCCHFSDAFSQRLGSGPLPSWVLSAAKLGAGLDDRYGKLQEVVAKGTEARGADPLMDTYRYSDVVRGLVAAGREDRGGTETPEDSSGMCIGDLRDLMRGLMGVVRGR